VIVIPAIDLLGGKAVRLVRGERDSATVFSDSPWELAEQMIGDGAERLHLVDLDGAFSGRPVSRMTIMRILHVCDAAGVQVQVGGGLRDRGSVEAVLSAGAAAVLGTAAVRDPDLVRDLCQAYPRRIVVAVDARDGVVAIEGWTEASSVRAEELGRQAADWGAAALLYTDVARDGTGSGPAVESTAALSRAVPVPVIASGGIGSLDHLRALHQAGIAMAVVGRALLEGRFTLAEAREAAC
jgi:phosphoribosylformimino-5-aminoimidazole carboxamide ribotide isomerase